MITQIALWSLPVIACLFVYAFIRAGAHQSVVIQKTVTAKSTPRAAYDLVRTLADFPRWSPFVVEDPAQKHEVKGRDGELGAQFHWVGNGGKDVGYQEIVRLDAARAIGMRCDIRKPFVAQPTFDYTFEAVPEGVRVTQVFRLKSARIDAFFLWAFKVVPKMGATNELGLSRLKQTLEQR